MCSKALSSVCGKSYTCLFVHEKAFEEVSGWNYKALKNDRECMQKKKLVNNEKLHGYLFITLESKLRIPHSEVLEVDVLHNFGVVCQKSYHPDKNALLLRVLILNVLLCQNAYKGFGTFCACRRNFGKLLYRSLSTKTIKHVLCRSSRKAKGISTLTGAIKCTGRLSIMTE